LLEEYGCKPIKCQFGGVVNAIRNESGKKSHWLVLTYLVQIDPREARNNEPDKFEEVRWFNLDELPEERHSFFDRDLATVRHFLAN
jgi:8-oxo-dGTP pyrophosphatase MutT (NUDIX family)